MKPITNSTKILRHITCVQNTKIKLIQAFVATMVTHSQLIFLSLRKGILLANPINVSNFINTINTMILSVKNNHFGLVTKI